jgi:hypothetical protein
MNKESNEFLKSEVSTLPLNDDLKELLTFHGYATLGDVLEQEVSFLRERNGLSIHDELALYKLVREYGLNDMWKG